MEHFSRRFQGYLKTGKPRTCEAAVGIGVGVQLERDQPETYPDSTRTLSGTIVRFFVNDAYRDTVPQQCDCNSQSRRTTTNLISVGFNYTVKAEKPYHKDR